MSNRTSSLNDTATARGRTEPTEDSGEGTVLDPQIWRAYLEHASKADQDMFAGWQSDMDTLLIFAALFSAVLTAFVIETYPNLEPDDSQSTAQLLQAILLTLQSNASAASAVASSVGAAFEAPASAVRINAFWFASLIISVSAAFLAILAKQWIYNLSTGTSPIPVAGGRQRQYRRDSMNSWKLPTIITALPVLLHLSVLLFFAGLVDFLWTLGSTPVAAVSSALVGVVVMVYVLTTSLSMLSPSCPYRTSVTTLILSGLDSLVGTSNAFIMAVGSRLGRISMTYIERLLNFLQIEHPVPGVLSEAAIAIAAERLTYNNKNSWHTVALSFFSLDAREDRRMRAKRRNLDASVLAWMVEHSSQLEDASAVAKELCKFPELIQHRALFLGTNSAALLMRHITSLYSAPFDGLFQEQQTEILLAMDVLASLVTESLDIDAPGTVSLISHAYPYFYDYLDFESYSETVLASFIAPGASPSAFADTNNIHFFANVIRLVLPAIDDDTSDIHDPAPGIDQFYQRLTESSDFQASPEHVRTVCLNAILYIGTTAANERIDSMSAVKYGTRSLEVLTNILERTHDLTYAMHRQILWGIWVCAYGLNEEHVSLSDILRWCEPVVPLLKKTISFSEHFAALLKTKQDSVVLDAVLAATENVLYATETGRESAMAGDVDTDRELLCQRLVDAFSSLLTSHVTTLRTNIGPIEVHGTNTYTKIISIAAYIAFSADAPTSPGRRTDALQQCYKLLRHLSSRLRHDTNQAWSYTWVLGTASRLALLRLEDPAVHQSRRLSWDGFRGFDGSSVHRTVVVLLISALVDYLSSRSTHSTFSVDGISTVLRILSDMYQTLQPPTEDMNRLRNAISQGNVSTHLRTLYDDADVGGLAQDLMQIMHA